MCICILWRDFSKKNNRSDYDKITKKKYICARFLPQNSWLQCCLLALTVYLAASQWFSPAIRHWRDPSQIPIHVHLLAGVHTPLVLSFFGDSLVLFVASRPWIIKSFVTEAFQTKLFGPWIIKSFVTETFQTILFIPPRWCKMALGHLDQPPENRCDWRLHEDATESKYISIPE